MFRERITEIFRLRSGDNAAGAKLFAKHMDGNRQTAARTVLVGVADEFDKNERQKQRGQEIKGTVLIARDAVISARLLARQFQIDLIMAGDGANVRILEHLQPGAETDNDAAAHALRRLAEDAVRRSGRMPQRERVKQFVQFLFRAAYKQLIRFTDVPPLRWIAALDKQDERLEKIHFGAVPEMVTPVAARIADDNIAEKLRHQLLPVDLGQAIPRIRRRGRDQIKHAHGVTLIAQIRAGFFVQFRLRITDNQRAFPRRALQDHIDAERARLFSSRLRHRRRGCR